MAISDEDTEPDGKSKLYGWGFGYYYQLGLGESQREDAIEPVKINIKYKDKVKHIPAGYFHSSVITK